MTYATARETQRRLYAELDMASAAFRAFPADDDKVRAYQVALDRVSEFNATFTAEFKSEIAFERDYR